MTKNKVVVGFVILGVVVGLYLFLGRSVPDNSGMVVVTSSTGTSVLHYTPPADVTSYATKDGSCFTNSIAAPYRVDAWRCMVGNEISDPCFQMQGSSDLLCLPDPTGVHVSSTFVLKLAKPLPKPATAQAGPDNWGWFVKLSDGTICTPYTGTRPFSAEGDVADYSCDSSIPGESMIFNGLNSSTTPWTAEVGSLPTSSPVYPPQLQSSTTVQVDTVWQ